MRRKNISGMAIEPIKTAASVKDCFLKQQERLLHFANLQRFSITKLALPAYCIV